MLDDDVCQLIESLWLESIGDLNQILSVPPESISLQTVKRDILLNKIIRKCFT